MEIEYAKEKLDQIKDHLKYEVEMFFHSALVLNKIDEESKDQSILFTKYVFVESFVIHARNLIYFLYPLSENNDKQIYPIENQNVIAAHIVSKNNYWEINYRHRPKDLQFIYKKTNILAAHFSYKRINIAKDSKKWSHLEIAKRLGKELKLFFDIINDTNEYNYFYNLYNQIISSQAKSDFITTSYIPLSSANTVWI